MARVIALFGAGASYGSDADKNLVPPMAAGLFDALVRYHIAWRQIPDQIAVAFRENFELAMYDIMQNHPHSPGPLQSAMADFFFNFVPHPQNLYSRLARLIARKRNWDGKLATLNYDRLLEISLASAGVQGILCGPPQAEAQVEYCLPHGCCNLFNENVFFSPEMVSFDARAIEIDGPTYKLITEPWEYKCRINGNGVPPVMCYFEPSKGVTAGHSFIVAQQERFKEIVAEADKVIVVGIQARPYDSHIWEPLASTDAHIVYCSGRSAAEGFNAWAKDARPGKPSTIIPEYFDAAFDDLMDQLELRD